MALYKRGAVLCFALLMLFLIFPFQAETSEFATYNPNQQMISRKLITISGKHESEVYKKGTKTQTERIGTDVCSKDDVVVYQGSTVPLPGGIPTYTVHILNKCVSGCAVSDIHLSCGWFSSARLVNPSVFRRLSYDDCLVNNGGSLAPGQSLSFVYANTYRYQLDVSSVACNS